MTAFSPTTYACQSIINFPFSPCGFCVDVVIKSIDLLISCVIGVEVNGSFLLENMLILTNMH
jgi:hypothetical protein